MDVRQLKQIREVGDRRHLNGNLFYLVLTALALAVLIAWLYGCGRAEAQTATATPIRLVQLPPRAATLCGANNTSYVIRQDVRLTDLTSGLLRYGPCYNVACEGERKCITGESPRAVIQEWMIYRMVGCTLDPGEVVTHTGAGMVQWTSVDGPVGAGTFTTSHWEEQIEDAGLTGQSPRMQTERARACAVPLPTPTTPVPTPTTTPPPAPTPTTTTTPAPLPTPLPAATPCPPQTQCAKYERITVPPKHARTVEFAGTWDAGNTAKLRERFLRLQALAVWLGGQLDKLYVPGVRSTPNITSTNEPCEVIAEDTYLCNPLSPPIRDVPAAPLRRCAP